MIKGQNGAGKSTLLKILTGAMESSSGEVLYYQDDELVDPHSIWKIVSLVAPYQELPEELSLKELIDFQINMSEKKLVLKSFENLVSLFEMGADIHKPIGLFSTGMKQKAKIILAIAEDRPILFLDEPTSNLDPDSTSICLRRSTTFSRMRSGPISTSVAIFSKII